MTIREFVDYMLIPPARNVKIHIYTEENQGSINYDDASDEVKGLQLVSVSVSTLLTVNGPEAWLSLYTY